MTMAYWWLSDPHTDLIWSGEHWKDIFGRLHSDDSDWKISLHNQAGGAPQHQFHLGDLLWDEASCRSLDPNQVTFMASWIAKDRSFAIFEFPSWLAEDGWTTCFHAPSMKKQILTGGSVRSNMKIHQRRCFNLCGAIFLFPFWLEETFSKS